MVDFMGKQAVIQMHEAVFAAFLGPSSYFSA
jgi:hypothetical protein